MGFAQLKKGVYKTGMPFSAELSEHTKFMSLDTWLQKQLRDRKDRAASHPNWSNERIEGYEQGLIDMALDAKNEIKRLDNNL
jgi:hypothetical protein